MKKESILISFCQNDSLIQEISYEDTEHYNLTLNFLMAGKGFYYELFRSGVEGT